jgi:hypothetical protein
MHSTNLRRIGPIAAAVFVLAHQAPAMADGNPLTLVVTESLSTDNNFLRRPDGGPSETTSNTRAGLSYNKSLGRQNYNLGVTVNAARHHEFKEYDYDGYNLSMGVNSGVGAKGYLSLQHNRSSSQQNPDEQTRQRFVDKVKQRSTSLFGQYGVSGRMGLNANLISSGTDYSRSIANNQDSVGLRLGVSYSPSDLLGFGLGVRRTDRNLTRLDQKLRRYDYDLSSSWMVTGYSTLGASIALSREQRDGDPEGDFKAVTGSLDWRYTPGGKLSYGLSVSRDNQNTGLPSQIFSYTGRFSTPSDVKAILTNQAKNQLTTSLGGRVNWAISTKTSAAVSLSYSRFEDSREAQIEGSISGLESQFLPTQGHQTSLNVSGRFTPLRWLDLGCSIGAYKRVGQRLSVAGYQGQTLGCDASVTLN